MYFLYLLECKDGSLYTGVTTDVQRRFSEHAAGKGGHYTRAHGALRIVHTEPHKDRAAASRREAAVKRLSRARKRALCGLS